MFDWPSSSASRRTLLAAGTASLVGLAGCSAAGESSPPTLDRILLRSDTGETEPVRLTLVHAPEDGSTERPVWKTVEAPADGDAVPVVQGLELGPGFHSLTAAAENHGNHEVGSFNSHGEGVDADDLQFEVVVKGTGDLWLNLNRAGESISIPG